MKNLIAALLLTLASTCALAKSVVINWAPNAPEQNVGWYVIYWDINKTGNVTTMPVIAETNQNRYVMNSDFFQPTEGQEICVRIVAARGQERSVPSESACVTYTSANPSQPITIPLTPVQGVTIEIGDQ